MTAGVGEVVVVEKGREKAESCRRTDSEAGSLYLSSYTCYSECQHKSRTSLFKYYRVVPGVAYDSSLEEADLVCRGQSAYHTTTAQRNSETNKLS